MKHQFLSVYFFVFASMFLLVSCQKEIVISPENDSVSALSKMSDNVPFKGIYTTTAQLLSPPPMLKQRITGTGQATHLGGSVFVSIVNVNLTTAPPFQVNGTAVFTAANGDEFYTRFVGTSTPTGNGTSTAILTHTVIGGTGRFKNASGNFVGTVYNNPANPTNTISYEGNLHY